MKKILLIAAACVASMAAMSQAAFVLNNSGSTQAFRSIDSAIAYAQSGDTLYLPGGTYNSNTIIINKKLAIFGAGHYPDSTIATGRTVLNCSMVFIDGASLSVLQGVYLAGNITMGSNATNSNVNGIVISRCNFNDLTFSYNGATVSLASNLLIRENVIRNDLTLINAKDNLIENNIIDGRINAANGSNTFVNNVVFGRAGASGYSINSVYSCVFENNIFCNTASYGFLGNSTANTFRNNVFLFPNQLGGGDVSEQNLFSVPDPFVNKNLTIFSYTQNFHLTPSSVAVTAGKGGTACGIYGGVRPYKESAVPLNPHVRSSNIAANTDNAGQIQVQVTVAAQQQ